MIMPWNKKSEKMKSMESSLKKNEEQIEAFHKTAKSARKAIDDLLTELVQIKKDSRNGDH